jgi:hypothetical protein
VADRKEHNKTQRLTWSNPEVKRLSAGSAEQGAGTNPDSGPAGNARS